ncbi:hypothetical protein MY3296_004290 [Beauveria thailandica]
MASVLRLARPAAMRLAARSTPMTARPIVRSFTTSRMNLEKLYTKDHEWIEMSADRKTAVIGITEYAAEQLGDVVYVELPVETGDFIEQGDAFGAVESVKSASDINAPVRCRVTEGNKLLEEKPATINKVPEDDSNNGGWIVKVELEESGANQADELMNAQAYKDFTDSE